MLLRLKIFKNAGLTAALLFAVAFAPRLINLGGHSVFVDEITWMSRAKDVYAAVRTLSWSPYNAVWWLNPGVAESIGLPITFLSGLAITFLSAGYSHFSLNIVQDFVAARVPAVVLGSLFVPLFYLLVRKFVGDKLAFVAALLFALDPIAIATSRWLHQDTPLMVFSTLSMLLYLGSKKKPAIIGSAFLAAMAILTKPQGFLVPVVLAAVSVISLITTHKSDLKVYVVWLLLTCAFTILFFPYLWTNPVGNMLNYLLVQTENVSGGNLTLFNGQVTLNPPWYYYFAIFPFRLPESVLVGFAVGLLAAVHGIKKRIVKNNFLAAALIYSILFVGIISLSDKKLGIRYLLGVWPYIYLVSAFGLTYIEKFINKRYRLVYWLLVLILPVWGILKFSPVYYLYHNNLITSQAHQNLEAEGYCDSVKPAIDYLTPKLYHGVSIMLLGCDSAINYYTGFTINKVQSVGAKPDFIIEETLSAQKLPGVVTDIKNAGYKEIKEIDFRGLVLAKIYQKP